MGKTESAHDDDVLDQIPRPEVIRKKLAEALARADALRRLLRVSRRIYSEATDEV